MTSGRPRGNPIPPTEVSIERDGSVFSGIYTVEEGMVRVSSIFGSKSTQQGGSPAGAIAKMLLMELIREFPSP